MSEVTVPITVRYRDLDPLGHVNNAVYATYLELGRVAYMLALARIEGRELPAQLDATGFDFIVAELTIGYKSPAYLGETLEVGVTLASAGRTSFLFEYKVRERDSGRLVATGRSVQVMFDYAAGRKKPVPADFLAAVEKLQGQPVPRT